MKRWLFLLIVMIVAGGALYYSNGHEADSPIGPGAIVNLAAQTQHELSRLPMQATRISDAEEIEIGNRMAAHRASEGEMTPQDTLMQQYVEQIGAAVVGGSTRAPEIVGLKTKRHLVYHFHYIPAPSFVNAYALPGGHVFIGKGLIALMDSEDELAMILAHEVEHVDRYHCAERVQVEARLRHLPLSGLVELPVALFQAGYNKDQEMEADREGVLLAAQAGYSAGAAVAMFEKFQAMGPKTQPRRGSPIDQLPRVALQGLAGYFRSHPFAEERKEQVEHMIQSGKVVVKTEKAIKIRIAFGT